MVSKIEVKGKQEEQVLQSFVALEIENGNNQSWTIRRDAHGNVDRRLVSVFEGPALSQPTNTYQRRDYFTSMSGSATREAGFEFALSQFMGWNLPEVPRFDGTNGPLYSQIVFPLMFVEQKRGWSGIQSTIPAFLRVREPAKRAIEFLLDLNSQELAAMRQILQNEEGDLKRQWTQVAERAQQLALSIGAELRSVGSITARDQAAAGVRLLFIRDGVLVGLSEEVSRLQERVKELSAKALPTVSESAPDLSRRLRVMLSERVDLQAASKVLLDTVQRSREETKALAARVRQLDEDIRRYQDVLQLQKLGSETEIQTLHGSCPTCHQSINESLLPQIDKSTILPAQANLELLLEQRRTFQDLQDVTNRELARDESRLGAALAEIEEVNQQIRSIRTTLVSSNDSVSEAAVQERVSLTARLNRYQAVESEVAAISRQQVELMASYAEVRRQIERLPKGDITDEDQSKLDKIQSFLIGMATDFGFSSFLPSNLEISAETFLPARDGFNLGFDVSGSDNVRVIWSYLLSLLEVSRTELTNHLGVVVFDEPQQQKPSQKDFGAFLRRASNAGTSGQQVLIASSEETGILRDLLLGKAATIVEFEGKLLKPVNNSLNQLRRVSDDSDRV
jgi:hypothetical protein